MPHQCRICASTDTGPVETFAEQMFRVGKEFGYFRCNDCGCLQIDEMPNPMAEFYPDSYYSYGSGEGGVSARLKETLRSFLAYRGPKSLFGGREWWERGSLRAIRHADPDLGDSILDLGCGSGALLGQLKDIGFRNLLGADPYLAEDMITPNGVPVLRREAAELDTKFDLVMMHHSLEHVWDQHSLVKGIYDLLPPGGKCIIRIPTVECWAWEHYHGDWVQLDPPRHFYLHSRGSITRLLESASLEVVEIVDDSTSYQILGSEKISTGASLIDALSKSTDFEAYLPKEMIATAHSRALKLNEQHRGDSIAVHARKPNR